ncbi:cytochrome-c peroxidase [Massilia sp. SM-13]
MAMRRWRLPAGALALVLLQACGGGSAPPAALPPAPPPVSAAEPLSDAAQLGQQMFVDTSLSASGTLSCAGCHVPGNAHAPANALGVQLGGADGRTPGKRATPSLRYQSFTPPFKLDANGVPSGGYDADGRVSTLAEQAASPLLAAHEMANLSKEAVLDKVRKAPYAERFRTVFGAAIFDDTALAFERVTFALQQFQRQEAAFRPFDSKFDRHLAGKAVLSAAEQRGLALFNERGKGNCAACHSSAPLADGTPPLFTGFGYYNLGVPRRPGSAPGADLGLCGPERSDLLARSDLCGAFKVPSLRNVATRQVFFHNGAVGSLREAVRFHVQRDSDPRAWYGGEMYEDLPPQYRANVVRGAPFDRGAGSAPALSETEIDEVVAFLKTLSDGYRP